MSGNHTTEGARTFLLGQEVRRWTPPELSEAVKRLKAKHRDRLVLHARMMVEFIHSSVILSSDDWHLLVSSPELSVLDIDFSTPLQFERMGEKESAAFLKQEGIAVIRISTDEELQRVLASNARRFEQEKRLFELFQNLRASERNTLETEKTIQEMKSTKKPAEQQALVQYRIQEIAKPVQEIAKPVQEIAKPVQEIAKPVQEIAKPVQEIAEPVQEIAKPVQEIAKPVQEIAKPVQEIAKPVQEIAKSKENCWSKCFGWLRAKISGWFGARFCQQTLTKNQIKKLKRKAKRARRLY